MTARLPSARALPGGAALTLLPFLDLLFAAIGLFLVLIFQALLSGPRVPPPGGDLLLVPLPGEVLWVTPEAAAAESLVDTAVPARLWALAVALGRNPDVVLAVHGSAVAEALRLRRLLEADQRYPAAAAPADARVTPRLMLRPLADGADARAALLAEWLAPPPADLLPGGAPGGAPGATPGPASGAVP